MAKKRAKKAMTLKLDDQLRQIIRDSGLSIYRIAKDSGVPQPMLHRFYVDEMDIALRTAARLAAYFGLKLTKARR